MMMLTGIVMRTVLTSGPAGNASLSSEYAASSNASGLPVFALAGPHPIRVQEVARSISVRPIDLP